MDQGPARFGSYLVYEQLGKGGMATVHRAELQQRNGSRPVALKRLLPTLQREIVALFLDEARLHRYLHHPNIAETYESGKVFGTYFIAMEFIKGPTLKDLVKHCGETVGTVPEAITLSLAAQLCDALDHAHRCTDEKGTPLGIIHRDITPSNVIISDAGLLKLIDFGLAKTTISTEETKQNVVKGKFGYIAPEYLEGKLDHRADLWAVGILMYELLTSRRLFDGPDAFETLTRVRSMPIPRPSIANPRVTPSLDRIVMKALERDPARRWQSAGEMRDALRLEIMQPGNRVDARAISDWVSWVFALQPGTDISGVGHLRAIATPDTEATVMEPLRTMEELEDDDLAPPPAPVGPAPATISHEEPIPMSLAGWIWLGGALALALVLAGFLAWKIVG